jgi:hypothetical protein
MVTKRDTHSNTFTDGTMWNTEPNWPCSYSANVSWSTTFQISQCGSCDFVNDGSATLLFLVNFAYDGYKCALQASYTTQDMLFTSSTMDLSLSDDDNMYTNCTANYAQLPNSITISWDTGSQWQSGELDADFC